MPTLSAYRIAIFDPMPPMPPSGPSTAPENNEAHAITMLTGSARQSIFVTSPARLSINDSSRLVGACRRFTRRPTNRENGRQIAGNSHGFARMISFSHSSRLPSSNTISQASTETAPMSATAITWRYGWTSDSPGAAPGDVGAAAPGCGPVMCGRSLLAGPADPRVGCRGTPRPRRRPRDTPVGIRSRQRCRPPRGRPPRAP